MYLLLGAGWSYRGVKGHVFNTVGIKQLHRRPGQEVSTHTHARTHTHSMLYFIMCLSSWALGFQIKWNVCTAPLRCPGVCTCGSDPHWALLILHWELPDTHGPPAAAPLGGSVSAHTRTHTHTHAHAHTHTRTHAHTQTHTHTHTQDGLVYY